MFISLTKLKNNLTNLNVFFFVVVFYALYRGGLILKIVGKMLKKNLKKMIDQIELNSIETKYQKNKIIL